MSHLQNYDLISWRLKTKSYFKKKADSVQEAKWTWMGWEAVPGKSNSGAAQFIDDWATIAIMKQALHNFKHNPLRSHQVNTNNNSDDEDGAREEEEPLDEEDKIADSQFQQPPSAH
ncbi:hypothetical protein M422DRAFT_247743 [Sphaerobolus stellatus SS14]|nr:hypothetical protein M422DRAFT_247743 [Sphaerobolus stellatus SS14]